MPWAAGAYSRLYGAAGWVDDRDAGTKILATRHDSHDQDLATGINNCMAKDGSNAATADISMGGFRLTNLPTTPTDATDAASKAYVDAAGSVAFASGDQILWRPTISPYTVPVGWAIAAQNNKALRIVSATGALTSAGTNAFTTAFNTARTTGAGGAHNHAATGLSGSFTTSSTAAAGGGEWCLDGSTQAVTISGNTASASTHTHTLNLDVQYYDMNIIQKT